MIDYDEKKIKTAHFYKFKAFFLRMELKNRQRMAVIIEHLKLDKHELSSYIVLINYKIIAKIMPIMIIILQ